MQEAKNIRKKEIRILLLRPVLNVYGVSKVLFMLADQLVKRGHTVFLASDNRNDFKSKLEEMGVQHYTVPLNPNRKNLFNFISCLFNIGLIVIKEKIDIIHSHHRWSSFISFFVSRILRVPLVTTNHAIDEGKKLLTLWGDVIISVSEDGKKHLVEYFKVDPKYIKVIHNGIRLPDVGSPSEARTDSDSRCPIIANFARLSPEKDQESLLRAMKIVIESHPSARLVVAGKGPLENHLRMLAEELGISKSADFLGEVEDVTNLLHCIDILVLCSLTEGLPISVLEALAFGKPVIATRVGDIPKVVIDGRTGRLVPPGNPRELANAISHLLANKDLASEMGRNGRELVRDKFGIERMTLETEKEYLELLLRRQHLRLARRRGTLVFT